MKANKGKRVHRSLNAVVYIYVHMQLRLMSDDHGYESGL